MLLRVAFHTLGCKLNQLETEAIADSFARAGASVVDLGSGERDPDPGDAPDLVVINTCTVTGKAEQKARRLVRLALASESAVVLVTGCYAELEAAALAALGERVLVLPGSAKDELLALPSRLASLGEGCDLLGELRGWLESRGEAGAGEADGGESAPARTRRGEGHFAYSPESFSFHSRPMIKVQDGCDNDCAYCRVHIARGPSRSLPAGQALVRILALEEAGRAEAVLTGVNLSQYRDGDMGFPGLLRFLLEGTKRIAFRLSSFEPDRIDAAFLDVFAHPRVRPHVHLALQSGADPVLEAMGRGYTRDRAEATVRSLRRVKDDPFIAADIIAGFPGETGSDASATLDLVRSCDFSWIHAFRFSSRPGTSAAAMRGRLPERLVGERTQALLDLGRAGRARYIDRWRGHQLRAVLERDSCVTSENYLKLKIRGLPETAKPGQGVICRVDEAVDEAGKGDIDSFALYMRSDILGELE